MKILQTITLESTDRASADKFSDAVNLLRLDVPSEDARQRHLRVIKGNAFTLEDAIAGVAFVIDTAKALSARANDAMFDDPKHQRTFADGIRHNCDLAIRIAKSFLANLIDEMPTERGLKFFVYDAEQAVGICGSERGWTGNFHDAASFTTHALATEVAQREGDGGLYVLQVHAYSE